MRFDTPNRERGLKGTYREDSQNPFPGFYRARVEFTADPKMLKRVKVRIPQMHGLPDDDEFIETKDLPWAYPMMFNQGGFDSGSYLVPQVGSTVWVSFEAGDPGRLIYGASVHGSGGETSHPMGVIDEDYDEDKVPAGKWDAPIGKSEIPKDAFDGKSDYEPTRSILFKSVKGHTFMTDDEDEKESLSIIDRAGQIIKMISPVKDDKNHTGDTSFKRGTSNSIKGDQKDYQEESYMSKAVFIIKDLAGQIIRSVAEYGKEKFEIASRNKDETRQTVLEMNSGDGTINYMLLSEDKESGNKIYLKADAVKLKLELVVVEGGTEKSRIELDGGNINQFASQDYNIKSNQNLNILSDLTMDIHAKEDMQIGSDINMIVFGSSSAELSSNGTVKVEGSDTVIQNGHSGYSGDKNDYSPPSDDVTWEDDKDEEFIEE